MYHANRMLLEHAARMAEERAARADLAAQARRSRPEPPPARREPFPALLIERLRLHARRSGGSRDGSKGRVSEPA